jgi:hypothetical protein
MCRASNRICNYPTRFYIMTKITGWWNHRTIQDTIGSDMETESTMFNLLLSHLSHIFLPVAPQLSIFSRPFNEDLPMAIKLESKNRAS